MDSNEYTWAWTSDLPLECVSHSVRIRHFSNQSVPSPWSNWVTNNGETVILYSESQLPVYMSKTNNYTENRSGSCMHSFTDKIMTSNKH